MNKILSLLVALFAVSQAQGQAFPATSAQFYTSSWVRNEPWCQLGGPPSDYMEHLMTQTESYAYQVAPGTPIKYLQEDEHYYFDTFQSKHLTGYDFSKNVWTYPNFTQTQGTLVHTQTDTNGNYTVSDSTGKSVPTDRQAHVVKGYGGQGCGGITGGTETIDVNGRRYLRVVNGFTGQLYRATLHLDLVHDNYTGLNYAAASFWIHTTANGGALGLTTPHFDGAGNLVVTVNGDTLYDITPTFQQTHVFYDYTYHILGTAVEDK